MVRIFGAGIVAALIGAGAFFYGPHRTAPTPPQPIDGRGLSAPTVDTRVMPQHSGTSVEPTETTKTNVSQIREEKPTVASGLHAYTQDELLAMAGSVDRSKLPLGDGKYTTTGAKKGYVYICHVATGGRGAMVDGPWIHGSTWDQINKIKVQGSVSWPSAANSFTINGATHTITTNDLPTVGTTGIFPIQKTDPAYQYDGNQSSIVAQDLKYLLPAEPTVAMMPGCIYGQVGVMTNGVTLYNGFDALYRDAAAHEAQDSCEGHPNNQGYHYHNLTSCIKNAKVSEVIGWAFDGFPITGPEVASGKYLSSDDLDECHGLTSAIMRNGKEMTTYHYVMTHDFPYSVSCFRGKSYEPKPGQESVTTQGGQQAQGSQQSGPPQEAMTACSGKSSGASCTFSTAQGDTITGRCDTPPGASLACVPR